jgi:hypothetical protein
MKTTQIRSGRDVRFFPAGREVVDASEARARRASATVAAAVAGMVASPEEDWDGFTTVPEGLVCEIADTSWDGRGTSVRLAAGSRFRMEYTRGSYSLARWTIKEAE